MVLKMGWFNGRNPGRPLQRTFHKGRHHCRAGWPRSDIPPDALVETINKHNKYLEEGKDPDFNKSITKVMIPMVQGPFYAVPQWPAIHHCMAGSGSIRRRRLLTSSAKSFPVSMPPVKRQAASTVPTGLGSQCSSGLRYFRPCRRNKRSKGKIEGLTPRDP